MDGSDCHHAPDGKAVFEDFGGDRIVRGGGWEKGLEVEWGAGKAAALEAGPLAANQRQRPPGSFGFRATTATTGAASPVRPDLHMACKNAGLAVGAEQRLAFHGSDASDAGAEREHDNICDASGRPGVHLSAQCETRVVFKPDGDTEPATAPGIEIKGGSVFVLAVG